MAADKNVGDGRTFSMRQVVAMLGAVTVMSGGGAALTVSASDAVQDSKIEALEAQMSAVRAESQRTTTEVKVVQSQVDGVKDQIFELRGLVIRALQRPAQ